MTAPFAPSSVPSSVPSSAPRRGLVARILTAVLGGYRIAISPALPPRCRYLPTCSAYAVEAIEIHGAGRGSWLALRRLLRCHPFHAGGHDLVPPRVPRADQPVLRCRSI